MTVVDEPALLEVRDLRTAFRTDRGTAMAVDGVSLELRRGRTLGVVGESGSGKTVLSRTIMGIVRREGVICEGSVKFEGREISQLPLREMRRLWGRDISMVFQDPMTSLNPVLRIGTQLTEPLRHHLNIGRGAASETALELLRSVEIPEPARRLKEYPHQLSGGMRQRVTIAIALACGPSLLLADEPTTALDVSVQAQILDLLDRQKHERDMTMMLVTHDLGIVAGRTDEVVVMYAGQIVESGPTASVFSHPRMPYTERLLASTPRLDTAGGRLPAIAGRPPDAVATTRGCRFAPRCPYVVEHCRQEAPPLQASAIPGHHVRCWLPLEADGARQQEHVADGRPPSVDAPDRWAGSSTPSPTELRG